MKRLQILRTNKGMTLIELIVVMILMGIVLTMIWSFFAFGNTMTNVSSDQYDVQTVTRTAVSGIEGEIRYATSMEILSTVPSQTQINSSTYSYIYLSGGKLYSSIYDADTSTRTNKEYDGDFDSYPASYFGKSTTSTSSIVIVLSNTQDDQDYRLSEELKLVNVVLNTTTKTVQGGSMGMAIRFIAQ